MAAQTGAAEAKESKIAAGVLLHDIRDRVDHMIGSTAARAAAGNPELSQPELKEELRKELAESLTSR